MLIIYKSVNSIQNFNTREENAAQKTSVTCLESSQVGLGLDPGSQISRLVLFLWLGL